MEKRLLLAVTLSLGLMLIWSSLMKKAQPIERQNVSDASVGLKSTAPTVNAAAPDQAVPDASFGNADFSVSRGSSSIDFIESKAAIRSITFRDYRDYVYRVDAITLNDPTLRFQRIREDDQGGVFFRHDGDGLSILQSYIFDNSLYGMKLRIQITNTSDNQYRLPSELVVGHLLFTPSQVDNQYIASAFFSNGKIVQFPGRKLAQKDNIEFASLRDRYFCFIVHPLYANSKGVVAPAGDTKSVVKISLPGNSVDPGQAIELEYDLYAGPQDIQLINAANPRWTPVVHYGPFDIISHTLLQIMGLFYKLVHNWGWSIILLSLSTYIILFPLSIKQMRSMKEMQKLQPHIEELRKTHKDNPQKMNREIMELYRTHKVNPLGGCLPILLQMPIFFALYPVLMRSAFLRGADFLWIRDLSLPDRIFTLPFSLPLLKDELNILPIVLALLMFVQQKASLQGAGNSAQAEQQKIMMIIMPIMFGFIFYHMPAGLVLYWLVNSLLMSVFQLRMAKSA